MFCTQMRLADRRHLMLSRNSEPSVGMVQRPCQTKNLENKNLFMSKKYNENDYQMEYLTPRMNSERGKRQKPHLVVHSIKMQSDVKTLAQDEVKRDPRRLPSFCEQYKQSKKDQRAQTSANENSSNDLMVRGVEMFSDHSIKENELNYINNDDDDDDEYHNDNDDFHGRKFFKFLENGKNYNFDDIDYGQAMMMYPRELLKIKLTDCCQCMSDVKLFKNDFQIDRIAKSPIPNPSQENRFFTIRNGQIDGVSYNSSANEIPVKPLPFLCSRPARKIPSPRTRQIINITLNNKK